MAVYGYARCSTNDKQQDINRQIRELKAAGAELIYQEHEHGDSTVKTEQKKLFAAVKPGDTIVTTEVSRLTRSTKQLCEIIDFVREHQLRLEILGSITVECRDGKLDPMTEAFLQMAGVFAQLERKMICERVSSGLANARDKGKVLGRPVVTAEDVPESFRKYYRQYKCGEIKTKKDLAKLADLSRPTVNKYIKFLGEDGK